MSEAEAFEQAIRANPDDGTAWRAYADWLAERDDPRGEFMQVQIALENEALPKAERKKHQAREKALLKKHEREWLGPLAPCLLGPNADNDGNPRRLAECQFRRGWLDRIVFYRLDVTTARSLARTTGARFLRELLVETTARDTPVGCRPYDEADPDGHYERGPDVPAKIHPCSGPALHALAHCPQLASVRLFCLGHGTLGLDGQDPTNGFGTTGIAVHHVVAQLINVEELYLFVRDADAGKIFGSTLPKLRVLQLDHNNSYPLERLAANKMLTNLTTLLCHPHCIEMGDEGKGAYIRPEGLRAICRSPYLKRLTHLRLRLTEFGDEGAREIVQSGILKRLKTLDLHGGCITDKGARLLAECPDFQNLAYLNMARNATTEVGQTAIRATGVKADLSAQHNESAGSPGNSRSVPDYLSEGDIE